MQQLRFEFFHDRIKVLVVGSGGREHALCWKLAQSENVRKVYCAPGNGGIARIAECVPVEAHDVDALVQLALSESIELTVVGPELPLALGIVDRFTAQGLRIVGPTSEAALLETSKVFAKRFMWRHNIPTAEFKIFERFEEAVLAIDTGLFGFPVAIKADGLAGGKGVIVARDLTEAHHALSLIMKEKAFGQAGDKIVIERFLRGEEASFMVLTDGRYIIPLAMARDYKRAHDGDEGPNTGGMGAFSSDDILHVSVMDYILERIVYPTIRGMAREGRPYRGVLYVGLMLTAQGPKVLEFNCRLGDPEAQAMLVRMQSDIVPLLDGTIDQYLDKLAIEWSPEPAVCVVLASGGYPGKYKTDYQISGVEDAEAMKGVVVFHAGTRRQNGSLYTSGGRVLGVTARAPTLPDAVSLAYQAAGKIHFEKMHYRRDIGAGAGRR